MLAWIEIFLAVIACFGIGAIYAITGYEVTNLFTDGPKWKPWQQALFWLFWPVIIPLFFVGLCLFILIAMLLIIITVVGYIYEKII